MPNYRTNGYQYETSPRKLEPEYVPQENPYDKKKASTLKKSNSQRAQKPKRKLKSHVKTVMYIGVVFTTLLAISYRNSLINEKFTENEKLKDTLAVTQKENEQLQVNIENSLNLSNIEKMAKEKLGMQKLDGTQKIYVSLPKKDYIEPSTEKVVIEETQPSWFQKIINMFLGK